MTCHAQGTKNIWLQLRAGAEHLVLATCPQSIDTSFVSLHDGRHHLKFAETTAASLSMWEIPRLKPLKPCPLCFPLCLLLGDASDSLETAPTTAWASARLSARQTPEQIRSYLAYAVRLSGSRCTKLNRKLCHLTPELLCSCNSICSRQGCLAQQAQHQYHRHTGRVLTEY